MADAVAGGNGTESLDTVASVVTESSALESGIFVAYGALVVLATLPIYYGSRRSVQEMKREGKVSMCLVVSYLVLYHTHCIAPARTLSLALCSLPLVLAHSYILLFRAAQEGEVEEVLTRKDALMFPLIASCGLFGLYLLFKACSVLWALSCYLPSHCHLTAAAHVIHPQFIGKEYVNLLLGTYFYLIGAVSVAQWLR